MWYGRSTKGVQSYFQPGPLSGNLTIANLRHAASRISIYFGTVYIWPMYHCLDKRIWLTIIFLLLKESLTLFKIWIFLIYLHLFCPNRSYWQSQTKSTPSILMDVYISLLINSIFIWSNPYCWASEKFVFELDASSYSFKITCILLRQATSLKEMVVSSAKFTTLISWSTICVPLILINDIGKYLSCNNAQQRWKWTHLANPSHKGKGVR